MELVTVTKDGEFLEVHLTALAQHKALGWEECEKRSKAQGESTSDESTAVETKKRGRPAKK